MTANDLFSSATKPPELDLLATGRLPPIVRALYGDPGLSRTLLSPMQLVATGELPPFSEQLPDRRSLATELAVSNEAYGHPGAAELAAKLTDPSTQVVVTGQQPGLYGGPLLALSKMVAVVRWAEHLETSGKPALAVFWVATEDHDWAELSQTSVMAANDTKTLDLGADPAPLLPIGMRTFGERFRALESEFSAALGHPQSIDRFQRLTGSFYRPDTRFGEAFCRFMVAIMGARAPLFLDAMLPEVKRLQQPVLRRLVERRDQVDKALLDAGSKLAENGLPTQVRHRAGQSPLFVLRGGERRRVSWIGGDPNCYEIRGDGEGPREIAELTEMIDDNPAIISAGVLARPVLQDALLGTTLQVLGPAELSYMTQVRALYPVLDVPAPSVVLRPQMVILDARHEGYLDELGAPLARIIDSSAEELLVSALDDPVVGPVASKIDRLLEELREPVIEIDRSLEAPWQKSRDQVARILAQLDGKVTAAMARRHEVWQRRVEAIRLAVLPNGKLQERVRSVADLTARYGGPELAELLLRQLELDPSKLQVIVTRPPTPDRGGEA